LVAICYFSNATDSGTRREMFIDGVSIAVGVLLPQLVFHATSVWAMQDIISVNNFSINSGAVQALNMEWVIVWAISMMLVGLAALTYRFTRRPVRRPHF
jgi:hypothetical protein